MKNFLGIVSGFVKSKKFILFLLALLVGGGLFWSGRLYEKNRNTLTEKSLQKSQEEKKLAAEAKRKESKAKKLEANKTRQPTVSGWIEKVDEKFVTVKKENGTLVEFAIDTQTKITGGEKKSEATQLEIGDEVKVSSALGENNQIIAKRILIRTPKATPVQ